MSNRVPSPRQRQAAQERPTDAPWRERLHEIVFEADTREGRAFDVCLMLMIVLSIMAVSLESVDALRERWGGLLRLAEWGFTVLFTLEYIVRLTAVRRPAAYARSFLGVVDLLALLPTYLSLLVPGAQSLLVIRALRLLRVFRVLKLAHFVGESRQLAAALRASVRKIVVFLFTVLTIVLIVGALMYLIEGDAGGFTSIPRAVYWAIVTMTTVGYGDIAPVTPVGQALASLLMILGYGIIAVPTGIVTVGLAKAVREATNTQVCPTCGLEGHADDARYCRRCGTKL